MNAIQFRSNLVIASVALTGVLACSRSFLSERAAPKPGPAAVATQISRMRSIDFSNFSYPWIRDLGNPGRKFTLTNGKYDGGKDDMPMQLFSIVYADVTEDGEEEALIALDVIVRGGSAAPNVIYIYGMKPTGPRLLWAFGTGDRTHGGLRRVYGEQGTLVVELYGKGKVIGTDLFADDGTGGMDPLPYYYTRTTYKWTGTNFERTGKIETLSDREKYGVPLMPQYEPKK